MADSSQLNDREQGDLILAKLEELKGMIESTNNENRLQFEQLSHRLESILLSSSASKSTASKRKSVVTKNSKNTTDEAKYSNTHYWFVGMFINKDPVIKNFYNEEDIKTAIASIKSVSGKPEDKITQKQIANAVWKNIPHATRRGEIKNCYGFWENEQNKNNTENADVEPDVEKKDEEEQKCEE